MDAGTERRVEQRPDWLLALGGVAAPLSFDLAPDRTLELRQVYKHDFFAHTARYGDQVGDVVVKRARTRAWWAPSTWFGRLVTWHEGRVFDRLTGVAGVPARLATRERSVLVHEWIAGRALAWGDRPPDGFLEALEALVAEVHAHDVAVVDLEKPGNVLLGDDGAPRLFDFQLAWFWPRALGGGLPPFSWILAAMQRADRYHLTKLRRRLRPDTMTPEEIEASRRRPGPVAFATKLVDPVRRLRRRYLARIEPEKTSPGERGRITR